MWKYFFLMCLLLVAGLVGCEEKPEPVRNELLSVGEGSNLQAAYKKWAELYGDSEVAAIGFNVLVLIETVRRHELVIRDLQKQLAEKADKKKKKGWF